MCQQALSLELLLHHRAYLVEMLLAHVAAPDCTSHAALLELLWLLALDLRAYIYPYFGAISTGLIGILDEQRPEIIEGVFGCGVDPAT